MGWASGSGLAEEIWDKVRRYVPKEERSRMAEEIYDLFVAQDADDWCDDDQLIKDMGE